MRPDGRYTVLKPEHDQEPLDTQTFFLNNNSNQWRAR
jgi:hypothetical protein